MKDSNTKYKKGNLLWLKIAIFSLFVCFACTGLNYNTTYAKAKIPLSGTIDGINYINGKVYYIKNGKLQKGFIQLYGSLSYFDPKTYELTYGIKKINNRYYYFDENGACVSNAEFNSNGSLKHGFYKTKKGTRYYSNGVMKTGFIKIKNKNYYFSDKTGYMGNYNTMKKKLIQAMEIKNPQSTTAPEKIGSLMSHEDDQELLVLPDDDSSQGTVTDNGVKLTSGYTTDPIVEDRDLLAALIYCEAGGERKTELYTDSGEHCYKGQLAVAYVIANCKAPERSFRQVVYKKNLFSPASNGRLTKVLNNLSIIPSECYIAADACIAATNGEDIVSEFPASSFKYGNFWALNYAKNRTNFFNIYNNEGVDHTIIEGAVFFNYDSRLKAK